MLTQLAVTALDKSPFLRRALWRWWYGRLARKFTQSSWTFMNYGYEPEAGTPALSLPEEFEADRLCVQLYEQVATGIPLDGARVVEVGSGRGGGARYLATVRAGEVLGIDYSKSAVKLCRRTHRDVANLAFEVGDAEALPIEAASCDVVLNVESSHCYGDTAKFFREVVRVLRPGGHFGIADFRTPDEMTALRTQLETIPELCVLESRDITDRVVAALERDDARKRELIEQIITPRLRSMFGEFAGLKDGRMFENLSTGAMVYHRFLLQKPPESPA